jgi:hypothetical protein
MFRALCGYLFSIVSNTIDSFDLFNIFWADRFSANPSVFPPLAWATKFGMALASETGAMLRIDCEAVMWKITQLADSCWRSVNRGCNEPPIQR